METNVLSISGGKDSTAMASLLLEKEVDNPMMVFADTGHEHPLTYDYVDYLDGFFQKKLGLKIKKVRADLRQRVIEKRATVEIKWRKDGVPGERIKQVLQILKPTGIPFLDLCMWKGRFPGSMTRFCTTELKHVPIRDQVVEPLLKKYEAIISWRGIRREESPKRAVKDMYDVDFGQWEPEKKGLLVYRPIIDWSVKDVFAQHKKHGIKPNPLYKKGMGRVGCMPCIMAKKDEIRQIALRYPEEIRRVKAWEEIVARVSKRGLATFYPSAKAPGDHQGVSGLSIDEIVEWALYNRTNHPDDLFLWEQDRRGVPACASVYGLCE